MQNRQFIGYIKKGEINNVVAMWNKYKDTLTPINLHYNNERPFIIAGEKGYIYVAKLLIELGNKIESSIDVNINEDEAFRAACINGNFDIARWLIEISPNLLSSLISSFWISKADLENSNFKKATNLLKFPKPVIFILDSF